MAREVEIKVWCDYCMAVDDVRTEAEELPPVMIGNAKAKVMAMCKQHREDFYEPFVEALGRFGVNLEKLSTTPSKPKSSSGGNALGPKHQPLPSGYLLPKGVSQDRASEYRVVCPVKDCMILQLNASQVANHLRQHHKTNLFETIGADGVLHDIDGAPVDTPKPRPYGRQNEKRTGQARKKS